MRRAPFALQIGCVATAAALVWLPLSQELVERRYSDGFYPAVQANLTALSNAVPFALFDLVAIGLLVVFVTAWWRCIRGALQARSVAGVVRGLWRTAVLAAALYLWFSVAWGLNYARLPIETRIGYDAGRVNLSAVRALAERTTVEVNGAYAAAHMAGFPDDDAMPASLVTALHDVERRLGRPRATTPGRPKRTLLAPFFRASGVDGMHAPFLLETLLNPDLTGPERPAVLAHEWAHMSGYAPEAEASLVGLLAALGADAPSRYSAWLSLFDHAVGQLPRTEQRQYVERLDPGPQADRRAINARLQARVEAVARASWETYDHYLKSQGVEEGIASYSRVVELLLGSGALDWR